MNHEKRSTTNKEQNVNWSVLQAPRDDRETFHFPRLGKRVENNGQALDVMARRQAGFGPVGAGGQTHATGASAFLKIQDPSNPVLLVLFFFE